jgi:hypothetical protein
VVEFLKPLFLPLDLFRIPFLGHGQSGCFGILWLGHGWDDLFGWSSGQSKRTFGYGLSAFAKAMADVRHSSGGMG